MPRFKLSLKLRLVAFLKFFSCFLLRMRVVGGGGGGGGVEFYLTHVPVMVTRSAMHKLGL